MIRNALMLAALAVSAVAGPCKPGHTSSDLVSTKTASTDLPTTTTSLGDIIITNSLANGRFANGIDGFDSEGEANHQQGGCFKDDGSPDNGCASLKAVGDSKKRFLGSFAGISQLLESLQPSNTVLYTVQFYYAVITVGGAQTCTVSASLSNRQFYSMGLFSTGLSISWNRVLTSVVADSRNANFGISMTCTGNGQALIYIDSVFVSNQVTPQNIDQFKLDFDASSPGPQPSSEITSTSTVLTKSSEGPGSSSTWLPKPDTSSEESEHSTPTPIGTKSWLPGPNTSSGTPLRTPSSWLPGLDTTSEASTPVRTPSPWLPTADTSTFSTPSHTPTSLFPQPDTTSEISTPSLTTTTKEALTTTSHTTSESETPTEVCKYTHGEECEFDRFNYPQDALCAYGAYFTGPTWTESRTNYPHQDNAYQCIAICKSIENCQSVGYWQLENRCIFTNVRIKESDFTNFNTPGGSWQHSYWVDKRCYKCPDCIAASVPNTPPERCSYKPGDACSRKDAPQGTVCGLNAYMGGGYWTGDQWIDQYPRQDSAGACAAICEAIRDCKGSAYKDGRCRFSAFKLSTTDGPIPLDTTRDASMNWPWDDPSCYTCPGCTE
ncbi:hypothetical protein FVEN_g5727 [Fusarium venenatum]|uniref:Apple domain-containing protein n=1 Tax=Fusarium venenatum TaxID=56646 RepID=A0A2L2U121_9HYPO|nr:uncharacterized protein FVRRES_04157 [Fusarium venenatum]KAG8356570.1 hypothetical protein FVEN_g5727 [Fusarium venenatum]KAH7002890.1 hypothetical protein EDB82DRAFT_438220 [Fusarium venenatum]CEI67645.1 unnamed protein product [Fusarium venenatum]